MSSIDFKKRLPDLGFVPDSVEDRLAYIFLAPLMVFLIFIVWVPFLQGIWMSLHNWPLGFTAPSFVGQITTLTC